MTHDYQSTDPFQPSSRHIAVVSAGVSQPSTTEQLGDRLAEATASELSAHGIRPHIDVINLRELAGEIGDAMATTAHADALSQAIKTVEQADALIAVTPTFKGSYTGLFKSFFDLLDDEAMRGMPVLPAATGGTARHSLVLDHALRPLFAYFRTRPTSIGVFAATDDWGSITGSEPQQHLHLSTRINDAGAELAQLMQIVPARERVSDAQPGKLEVINFEELLK